MQKIAFEKFKEINALKDMQQKHRAWLKDYEGLNYSVALREKHILKWKENWDTLKYSDEKFRSNINMIARKPNRLIIEFDNPNSETIPKCLEEIKQKLKENQFGFIESTHKGKSNYIWVEFTRDLTTEEAKLFLDWISPKDDGVQIDLNFTSDEKLFVVLFAIHWRHSENREIPIEFLEGNQIDYDSLGIAQKKLKTKTISKKGFDYEILDKSEPKKQELPSEGILQILQNPNLFNEITEQEFNKKIVGEIQTRKVIFLCSQGNLIENCQIASYNLLVNDEAGSGKDYVTGSVLDILPKEIYIHKTRISPAVFTYWKNSKSHPNWTWDGKVFYPEDISEVVLNSEVFKVMTSKGSSATIVIKQKAVDIEIKGKPVMITTTATATPNPELTRRFVILNLDSSEKQTKEIMKRHSEFKEKGIIPEYNPKYTEALSCLKRVKVKIPFAQRIYSHFPDKSIIMRTHYPRFLDFISASAGFHQYQRKKDYEGYIIAEGKDYDIARECLLKLCSNKYMIPLTINQKKILELFENNPFLKGSASFLHSNKINFLSLPALQSNLQTLVGYGILETFTDKDSWNRDIEVYCLAHSYKPNEIINIPTYEELCRNTLEPLEPILPLEPLIPLIPQQKEVGIKDVKGIKPNIDIRHITKKEEKEDSNENEV